MQEGKFVNRGVVLRCIAICQCTTIQHIYFAHCYIFCVFGSLRVSDITSHNNQIQEMSVSSNKSMYKQQEQIPPFPQQKKEYMTLYERATKLIGELREQNARDKLLQIFRQANKYFGLIYMVLPQLEKEQIQDMRNYFSQLSENDEDDDKLKKECNRYIKYIDGFLNEIQKKQNNPQIQKKSERQAKGTRKIFWESVVLVFEIVGFATAVFFFYTIGYQNYNSRIKYIIGNCTNINSTINSTINDVSNQTYLNSNRNLTLNNLHLIQEQSENICEFVDQTDISTLWIWIPLGIALATGILYFFYKKGFLPDWVYGGRGGDANPNPTKSNKDPKQPIDKHDKQKQFKPTLKDDIPKLKEPQSTDELIKKDQLKRQDIEDP